MPSGVSPQVVVTQTRPKQYVQRRRFYPPWVQEKHQPFPKPNWKARKELWSDDPGGQGYEIVKECQLCPDCYQQRQYVVSLQP